jgi:hypothetical protein
MNFTAIVLLALPLASALPPRDGAVSAPLVAASAPLDRDAFNAMKRSVVLQLPKGD